MIPLTVVLRSFNDAALLPRTLAALDAQRGVEVRLHVCESASTDNSQAILDAHGYARCTRLTQDNYWSSAVLNAACQAADTELIAFVNSDAILRGDEVLLRLCESVLAEGQIAGAFARQEPRINAAPLTRLELHVAFGCRERLGADAQRLSLVCSVIRRSVWLATHFDERLTYAEDWTWSRDIEARGLRTVYVPAVAVEHSHDYNLHQAWRRAWGDAAAMAYRQDAPPKSWLRCVLFTWPRRCLSWSRLAIRLGLLPNIWHLPGWLWPRLDGAWHGARAGWQAHHGPNPTARQPMPPAR